MPCGTSEKFGGSRNFRSNVRISGRTFKIRKKTSKFKKTGNPKNSVVVGISGRTFEFPVERSKFKKTGHPKNEVPPPNFRDEQVRYTRVAIRQIKTAGPHSHISTKAKQGDTADSWAEKIKVGSKVDRETKAEACMKAATEVLAPYAKA